MWPGAQGAHNADYQIKFLADRIVRAPYWHAQLMLSESHQPSVVGGYHTTLGPATPVEQQPNATCKRPGTGDPECSVSGTTP